MIIISVCLPFDAPLKHLPSYLGLSYLGRWVSLHGCSSKVQLLLPTLDEGYLLTAAPLDPEHGVAPPGHPGPRHILECEVKWVLESITTNKASGGDGIPVELFQILKDDAVKVLHSMCQQIWKTQQWPQDWKRSVFIPIPKKGNAKECSDYCTIALISRLSDFTFTFHFRALEKEMGTHSSVLAWRIPGMGEPGGLPSMGSHRVGHD